MTQQRTPDEDKGNQGQQNQPNREQQGGNQGGQNR